jgi:hypothetical protein
MVALISLLLNVVASLFKSKSRLEAENAALRHQLIVLQRKVRGRVHFTDSDRLFLVQLYRWFPSILQAITIIRPETLVRWHRAGFRRYWRWKSRSPGGRPKIAAELRALIRGMSVDNPLWGAPRIHGELLKLGFEIAQSTVAKYMVKRCGPPSQGWRTFLRNHAPDIAAIDLFVVPTIGFDLLYGLVIVRLARRDLVWINATTNPTAEWVARQITEACRAATERESHGTNGEVADLEVYDVTLLPRSGGALFLGAAKKPRLSRGFSCHYEVRPGGSDNHDARFRHSRHQVLW